MLPSGLNKLDHHDIYILRERDDCDYSVGIVSHPLHSLLQLEVYIQSQNDVDCHKSN